MEEPVFCREFDREARHLHPIREVRVVFDAEAAEDPITRVPRRGEVPADRMAGEAEVPASSTVFAPRNSAVSEPRALWAISQRSILGAHGRLSVGLPAIAASIRSRSFIGYLPLGVVYNAAARHRPPTGVVQALGPSYDDRRDQHRERHYTRHPSRQRRSVAAGPAADAIGILTAHCARGSSGNAGPAASAGLRRPGCPRNRVKSSHQHPESGAHILGESGAQRARPSTNLGT